MVIPWHNNNNNNNNNNNKWTHTVPCTLNTQDNKKNSHELSLTFVSLISGDVLVMFFGDVVLDSDDEAPTPSPSS